MKMEREMSMDREKRRVKEEQAKREGHGRREVGEVGSEKNTGWPGKPQPANTDSTGDWYTASASALSTSIAGLV